ncbi:MAG: hypothetical protein IJL78_09235 [Lachnospiraceae bacterium]|nr:hypothetical protein [Lachnospiraceae bacterium]
MKVLAISMGRKNQNCDIISKQALMAAEKAGANVKFINTWSARSAAFTDRSRSRTARSA